jgi:prolyl oligopeptidase
MLTSYPELINASICLAPLTDLMRYNKLFAGDSWVAELGDPDDEKERAALLKLSPFHSIKKDGSYPMPLLLTNKSDDRVHPGHGRRMVAKMQEHGFEALYYESKEGGHSGGSGPEERAKIRAMEYEYFKQRLFDSNESS